MVALFSRLAPRERTPRRSMPGTGEQVPVLPPSALADPLQNRPPAEPGSWSAGEPLRCLWYHAGLADTLAVMDEFLRTPAAAAALADFCRARRGGPAAPLEARTLAGAVALVAARMCP
jgi:hypothetical protein